MQYRRFGKTEQMVSILGFGCMRLPLLPDTDGQIDEALAISLIREAIDQGVNYIDTAYPYHGQTMGEGGASEPLVGRALQDGYREKVFLATKSPCWLVQQPADFDRFLDEQLKRLQTDHIDFYLMHALDTEKWAILQANDFADFLDRAIASGRIRYAGFSFHDKLPLFKEIVDAYDWSFCQIQYNYLDEAFQAGTEGLRYAAERDLGVTIMEPLRGGKLAGVMPPDVQAAFDQSPIPYSPAQWGLRWVWNHPEVSVVLSGLNQADHLAENLRTAESMLPDSLTADELAIIDQAKAIFKARTKVDCTGCRYCQPCPNDVPIPQIFKNYNNIYLFGDNDPADRQTLGQQAAGCIKCGLCEEHCPQSIAIREQLSRIALEMETAQ